MIWVPKAVLKSVLPKTLLARALMILILPVLLVQIFTAFIFFDRHWSKVTARLAANVAGEVALAAQVLEDDPGPEMVKTILRYVRENLDLDIGYMSPSVLSGAGERTADGIWSTYVAGVLYYELDKRLDQPLKLHADFRTKRVDIWVQLGDGVLAVSVAQSKLFSSSSYIFLLWVIGTSFLLLVVSILFMRNQIRPIRRLAVASERFGRGLELLGFKAQGALEVRQAAEAFLLMRKRIQRQVSQRTDMLAGVSHDLRTPLTRMKLQLAMMGDDSDIVAMRGDVDEMEQMLGGYLDFVRGEGVEAPEIVSLNALLDKGVANISRHSEGEVVLSVEGDIDLTLRPVAFERCLNNILDNACKYALNIWVRASLKDGKVLVVVEDDGEGVPPEQYEDVFKPFYRVDSSRSSGTGSVGLGLSIAMDIVHSHGGKIWLQQSEYGGLAVCVQMPL